ncbi:alpha/beta fold hydrolase [Streptomyces sp. SP18CS02]|uniref:alpha/beta fold hydrolase n=1 Tax=Streptomyces sp. SP18CS02 TaxID=3002531 RepID=UPI002E7A49BF|nr:alpha/beta fold hydrolase [Streptomyces sp. SP18CS02]MEE1756559.1 alpha/beta fold hydrolase [Streptomyces sp. SP18CS02]
MRVELGDVTLAVADSAAGAGGGPGGEDRTVLLVHGFPDTHACWRHQVPALNAAGYRTIAPDLRGFGASGRPEGTGAYGVDRSVTDLLELLDRLDLARVHLVGHDWGSGIVQSLAMTAPDRVRSLSLLSVGHLGALMTAGWEQRQRSWYIQLFQLEGLAEEWLSRDDFANLREMLTEHPDREEAVSRMREPGALTAALSLYRTGLPSEVLFGPELPLPSLPGPVLGLWSTDDRFLTERSMTGTEKHVAGSWRYERVEGGHWLQLEAPDRVNTLLLDFLAGTTAGSANG